jgi:dTDP-4-dehydrorhamnose reductase
MRILVTGVSGQVVTALRGAADSKADVTVFALGRPDLDLEHPIGLESAFARHNPDILINAAAYTAVDLAEEEAVKAHAINGAAPGKIASAASALGIPIIQISTDYVFDGSKANPYVETDPVAPIGTYGRSKLVGEQAVAAATDNHAIIRTSWVYAATGKNFFRTMLRLAETRDEIAVVADQKGCPSFAPDIAEALIGVARNLVARSDTELRGIFHLAGSGATDWAGFAESIFAHSQAAGGRAATVRRIATVDYPTPARRPANSVLDCSKLARIHGVSMPPWQDAVRRCIAQYTAEKQD